MTTEILTARRAKQKLSKKKQPRSKSLPQRETVINPFNDFTTMHTEKLGNVQPLCDITSKKNLEHPKFIHPRKINFWPARKPAT